MKKSVILIALAFLVAGTVYSAEKSASGADFKVEKEYLTKGGGTVKIIEKIAEPSDDMTPYMLGHDKNVPGTFVKINDYHQAKILYPLTVINNTDYDVSLSFEGVAYYEWFVRQDVLYFEDQPNPYLLTIGPKTTKSLNIKFYNWWVHLDGRSYIVGATWNYYIIFVPDKAVASYTAPANLFYCRWHLSSGVARIETYDFKDSFPAGNKTFTTTFKETDGRYCITFDQ